MKLPSTKIHTHIIQLYTSTGSLGASNGAEDSSLLLYVSLSLVLSTDPPSLVLENRATAFFFSARRFFTFGSSQAKTATITPIKVNKALTPPMTIPAISPGVNLGALEGPGFVVVEVFGFVMVEVFGSGVLEVFGSGVLEVFGSRVLEAFGSEVLEAFGPGLSEGLGLEVSLRLALVCSGEPAPSPPKLASASASASWLLFLLALLFVSCAGGVVAGVVAGVDVDEVEGEPFGETETGLDTKQP